MKKNEKGFTMIELLAVIVIIGLLVAIAIPSVTKYITESRRKTVASSIDGYITAVTIDVNNKKYKFTNENTIYALPIECVSLEKGGKSPFGEWSPANDDYWAYVLVQYNHDKYIHTYGFTFKDSAGYGLYPTNQDKVNLNDTNQIKTGLNLTKPANGLATSTAPKEYWNGFEIDDDTNLVVLERDSSNKCAIKKEVQVGSGTGTNIGDIITIRSERFYIIETSSTTITMLAANPINLDVNNPIQNATAGTINFSSSPYWISNSNLKPEYGSTFPAYVYDSNSKLYQYIEAYESYLKKLGATTATAKLISYEQLVSLGCIYGGTCQITSYKNWLLPGYSWITGSAMNNGGPLHGISGERFSGLYYLGSTVIRPVVTISKTEIKFN